MKLSWFRGAPVLVSDRLKDRAFCLGLIVIGKKEYALCRRNRSQTLQHEYGHVLQFLILGLPVYLLTIAVPSFICYWAGWMPRRYYCFPWEYTADVLGRAKRPGYPYGSIVWSWIYFAFTCCISLFLRGMMIRLFLIGV